MGLDIFTDNTSQRVGSYGMVHTLRREMIHASIITWINFQIVILHQNCHHF